MGHPTGESEDGAIRVDFDRRLRLEAYELLEVEGYKSTIRLPANSVLQERIVWLL